MAMLLLPELARENAASNRRVAQSVTTAAQRMGTVEEAEEKRVTLRQSAREAMRYTLAQATEARSLWQGTLTLFEDGLEGGEAREALRAMAEVFEAWFGLDKTTRELWQRAIQTGAVSQGLEELDAASHDVATAHKAAEELDAFLGRTRPPVDATMLENARQAIAQGRYKTPELVRSRLHKQEA